MMSEELKPCPFCGGTNLDMRKTRDFIKCIDCGTEGPFTPRLGSTGSIEAWNSRADNVPDAGKKVAALELALKAKTEQLSGLHKQIDTAREAIASLESERAANAILTAEIEALRTQKRQDCEPVAWQAKSIKGGDWGPPITSKRIAEEIKAEGKHEVRPLYTAPPKREPLSREKIRHLMSEAGYVDATPQERADFINGARFAEKGHGIGGQS